MKHQPEVESRPTRRAHLRPLIAQWLALDRDQQNEVLPRLIAATLHDGPGSSLARFVRTGQLHVETALEELLDAQVPVEREEWVAFLRRYVTARGGRL